MDTQELFSQPPLLHRDGNDKPVSYQINLQVLLFLEKRLSPNQYTLETGGGISTIFFALKNTHHICMIPDQLLQGRIQQFCFEKNISLNNTQWIIDRSENALPKMSERFDIFLIDGRHAFPTPFIDWYYGSCLLKVGGWLIIDDTHLWTGKILKKFLMHEPEWKMVRSFKTAAIFEKIKEGSENKTWVQQKYTFKKSRLRERLDIKMKKFTHH